MRPQLLLCFTLLLSGPPPTFAEAVPADARLSKRSVTSAQEAPCDDDLKCQQRVLKRKDAELNKTYQQFMKAIAPSKQAQLREVQRLWVRLVEKNCSFEASAYSGGSLEPLTYTLCRMRLTEARTNELSQQLEVCNAGGSC
jgi:uncharacterized protein YecT (DUF1311 family)